MSQVLGVDPVETRRLDKWAKARALIFLPSALAMRKRGRLAVAGDGRSDNTLGGVGAI